METRLPITVHVATAISAARITPTQPKVPFAQVMGQTAVLGAEAAMSVLPGGPVMAAALRSGGAAAAPGAALVTTQTMSQPLSAGVASLGPSVAAGSSSLPQPTPLAQPAGQAAAAEGPGAVTPAGGTGAGMNVDGALAQSQEMNLYYLRIQEQVNAENRSFTTMSNVMKAEHETVKTAIGNIR